MAFRGPAHLARSGWADPRSMAKPLGRRRCRARQKALLGRRPAGEPNRGLRCRTPSELGELKVAQEGRPGGFTLIEMMAVVLILGVVMSVVVVNVMDRVEWAKVQTTKVKMRAVEGALEMHRLERTTYPETEPGLVALLEAAPGGAPLVRDEEALDDAWRRRFGYEHPGGRARAGYDLWSLGRDGGVGGVGPDADITNWKNVSLVR